MHTPKYGDIRLTIVAPDGTAIGSYPVKPANWAYNLALSVLPRAPWSQAIVERYRGSGNGWETDYSVQRRPGEGWAAPGVDYCRDCGVVAFDGAMLPCGCAACDVQ